MSWPRHARRHYDDVINDVMDEDAMTARGTRRRAEGDFDDETIRGVASTQIGDELMTLGSRKLTNTRREDLNAKEMTFDFGDFLCCGSCVRTEIMIRLAIRWR